MRGAGSVTATGARCTHHTTRVKTASPANTRTALVTLASKETPDMAFIEVVMLTVIAVLVTAVMVAFYEPKGDQQ